VATRQHLPQLDGIRAVAIAAVVAFHLGFLRGGWLGVDVFFVLSGYLITSILVADGRPIGTVVAFWGRRARRLLPAVLLLLIVLSLYAWIGGPGLVPAQLRNPALATLFYVANWQQIIAGHGYFAQFTAPSPLQHTWSLAIEEQYYLCWPLVLGVMLAARSARPRWPRHSVAGATLVLALASLIWMGVAAHLLGPNRAYLGTDTRAWELLLGGAAAMVWPPGEPVRARRLPAWSVAGVVGLVGVAVGASTASGPPWWIWDGGLGAIALCSTLLIVGSVRAPGGPVARVLSLRPVQWLGLISYSLYLWHWPAIVLMTAATTGLTGWQLLVARLAAMLAASCASFYLVERPLRRADWGALARRLRVPAASMATAGVLATTAVIVAGTVGPPEVAQATVSSTAIHNAAGTPSIGEVDVPVATREDPVRVGIFGDSVMVDSSLGITAALQSTGAMSVVTNTAFPGWGLTRDPAWPADVLPTVAASHPQIMIGTWYWDDRVAHADPAAYRARLERAMRALLAPGDGVELIVLLQYPQTGPNPSITDPAQQEADWARGEAWQVAWNTAAREAVKAFPGHAIYLTTEQLFAPDGRFLAWMHTSQGTWVRARKVDDDHMCPYGAAAFGALLTEDFTPLLHLPAMRPGWEYGSWTSDPRYNDPPGACPGDQPPAGYRGDPVPRVGTGR
jgi:peptidoglycan/LPS O-acetylase OafA/YrhL